MKTIKVSAPGKLHLLGEHAVVYNKPAIITAVGKRCFVEIVPRTDGIIKVKAYNYKKEITTNFKDVIEKFDKSQKDWETCSENNDIVLLKSITKDLFDYPLIIIGQFLNYYKLNSVNGFELIIGSQIPVGAGMGSSGALSVSIVGALSLFLDKPFDKKVVNKIAFLAEQKKHGKPSGGDNTASCFGGLVWFKKDEDIKPLDLSLPPEVSKNYYIINTGIPSETTGEMVSLVRGLMEKEPASTQKILDEQEKLAHKLLPALKAGNDNEIISIVKAGEQNLEKLGVVSLFAKKMIRDIEKSGGAAKICGGGGKTKGTGIVLIYHQSLKNLEKVLKSYRLKPVQLVLGVEGLREELN
ncbi:MAG: mevalonate kinase [Patescibacteria group bacterium]|nr:mevalonate kinase [Patescibacteria group bacterium]